MLTTTANKLDQQPPTDQPRSGSTGHKMVLALLVLLVSGMALLAISTAALSQSSVPSNPRATAAPDLDEIEVENNRERSLAVEVQLDPDGTARVIGSRVIRGPVATNLGAPPELRVEVLRGDGEIVLAQNARDPRLVFVEDAVGNGESVQVFERGVLEVAVPIATSTKELRIAEFTPVAGSQMIPQTLVEFDLRPTISNFCQRNRLQASCRNIPIVRNVVAYETDCIRYEPAKLQVRSRNGLFQLTDGESILEAFNDQATANAGRQVAARHNRQCFIGRQNRGPDRASTIVTFWMGDSGIDGTYPRMGRCVNYDPKTVTKRALANGNQEVRAGRTVLVTVAKGDGAKAVALAKDHNRYCTLGTDQRGTEYWINSNAKPAVVEVKPGSIDVGPTRPPTGPVVTLPNGPIVTVPRGPIVTVPPRTPVVTAPRVPRAPTVTVPRAPRIQVPSTPRIQLPTAPR